MMEACSSCVPALASGDVFFLLCAVALMVWMVCDDVSLERR